MQTAVKRQLDDVMADIKTLSAAAQQKLKGFLASVCAVYVFTLNCVTGIKSYASALINKYGRSWEPASEMKLKVLWEAKKNLTVMSRVG